MSDLGSYTCRHRGFQPHRRHCVVSVSKTHLSLLSTGPTQEEPGRVAQSVTCLATDACLTAIPVVASSIPARSHTFVEIDHEIFLRSFSSLPLVHSRRVVVSYKRKYVHELLVIRLFKPDRTAMTIAVDLGRKATNPTNQPKKTRPNITECF